jgi:hypothetical protein
MHLERSRAKFIRIYDDINAPKTMLLSGENEEGRRLEAT